MGDALKEEQPEPEVEFALLDKDTDAAERESKSRSESDTPTPRGAQSDAQSDEVLDDSTSEQSCTSPTNERRFRVGGKRRIKTKEKGKTMELFKHPAFKNMREKAQLAEEAEA